jgi:hypothetical protein
MGGFRKNFFVLFETICGAGRAPSSLRGALATKQSSLPLRSFGLLRFARNDGGGTAAAVPPSNPD